MVKREAKYQTVFNQYLREQQKHGKMYGFYELKQTDKDYFPFSKMEKGQLEGLPAAEHSGLVWKWSDEDSRQKICDCVSIPPLPSYLVIKFLDGFYVIRIGHITDLKDSGAISISRAQSETLAFKIIKTNKK